jgi:peroxiredoxin
VKGALPVFPSRLVGMTAPELTLPDGGGRVDTLSDLRGKRHVVLIFFRGKW